MNKKLSTDNLAKTTPKLQYFKLPYIGKSSQHAQRKIKDLCNILCKETNIKLSFSLLVRFVQ